MKTKCMKCGSSWPGCGFLPGSSRYMPDPRGNASRMPVLRSGLGDMRSTCSAVSDIVIQTQFPEHGLYTLKFPLTIRNYPR